MRATLGATSSGRPFCYKALTASNGRSDPLRCPESRFLAVRHLIDRNTGEGRVGSLWTDEATLAASLAQSEQRRAVAKDRGVEFGDDRVLEVLYNAM